VGGDGRGWRGDKGDGSMGGEVLKKGWQHGWGEGRVRAIPDVAGLLLTGNTVPDCWTPCVFIDPYSSFLCPFDCNVVFLPFSVVSLPCLTTEIHFPLSRILS
jgi:hypothetical protein